MKIYYQPNRQPIKHIIITRCAAVAKKIDSHVIVHVQHVIGWERIIQFQPPYLQNLASTEYRILSSVYPLYPWPQAYCQKGLYNQKDGVTSLDENVLFLTKFCMHYVTGLNRHRDKWKIYLWAQTRVIIKGPMTKTDRLFLILSIATVLVGFWI